MKTSNIIILSIFAIIGGSVIYYLKKNKLQVVNNVEIEKKIDKAVKEIVSINKINEDVRVSKIDEELKTKTDTDNKEAENYIKKTLLIKQLNSAKKVLKLVIMGVKNYSKEQLNEIKDLNIVGVSVNNASLRNFITKTENTLKREYGLYPDNNGDYKI